MTLKDQLSSMALVIGLIQVARRIDQSDPKNILLIRLAYGGSQILLLLAILYLRRLVQSKNEKAMIEVEEAAAPFSTEAPKKQRMSIRDYDLGEVSKQLQQSVMGLIFMSVLHLWFGLTQPLILQAIMPWKNFLLLPLVKIHFWGMKAEGDLARPWKQPSLFDVPKEAAEQQQQQSLIEEIVEVEEKKGAVGEVKKNAAAGGKGSPAKRNAAARKDD